jgi:hypothetical protein
MKNGRWSAIRDDVVDEILSNRPASIGDFHLIITQLYRHKTSTSIALLAKRLCWSREKVRNWLERVGLEIEYSGERKNPKGGILKAVPKENLDPKNSGLWIVIHPPK